MGAPAVARVQASPSSRLRVQMSLARGPGVSVLLSRRVQVRCRNRLLFDAAELQRFRAPGASEGQQRLVLPVDDSRAQHITRVLRARRGDAVRIGVLNGPKATALLASAVGDSEAEGALVLDVPVAWRELSRPAPPTAQPRTDLLLAMPRPKVRERGTRSGPGGARGGRQLRAVTSCARAQVMRRLWAQVAALGVGSVVVTGAERVEPSYFTSHVLHADAVRSAWHQSGRG
eukprot:scaffold2573_cov268-Prasinococcus_capsulatus_cf.AAC.2